MDCPNHWHWQTQQETPLRPPESEATAGSRRTVPIDSVGNIQSRRIPATNTNTHAL